MKMPLHAPGLFLLAAALFGCKDASTDPARGVQLRAGPSADLVPSGAVSSFHFVSEGDFGGVSWFAPGPSGTFTFGFLNVSEGGSVTAPHVFLFYEVFQCCTFGFVEVSGGFGSIPAGDLTGGTGSAALRLNTNTANDPNFVVFAGSGGLVSVQWQENSAFEFSQSGTFETQFGKSTFRTIGSSSFSSATVTGTVVGLAIPQSAFGQMGTNHSVTIDIFRQ